MFEKLFCKCLIIKAIILVRNRKKAPYGWVRGSLNHKERTLNYQSGCKDRINSDAAK